MSGDLDGIGEAVTAGLAGHAVEPRHGGADGNAGLRCLNCGTSLGGSHCHHCGQKASIHRSFGAIGYDLVHAVFHFEGKLWNTLPLLIWRPGDLTRRYIHGERARFISPLSLFLFAVFLTYAVLALVGTGNGNATGASLSELAADRSKIDAVRINMDEELASIDAKLASPDMTPDAKTELTKERTLLAGSAGYLGLNGNMSAPGSIGDRTQFNSRFSEVNTGIPLVDKALTKALAKANANPSLLFYKVQANAYKFAWALIPISLPFLWMLFPFSRRFHTYDHFVFITYSISFALLLFVAARLLDMTAIGTLATFAAMLYVPVHMYRQLRGAYRSSRVGAAVRTIMLMFFSLFAVITFIMVLFAFGMMG